MKVWFELLRVYVIGLTISVGFTLAILGLTWLLNNQYGLLAIQFLFGALIAPFILGLITSPDRLFKALTEASVKKSEKK